MKTIRFIFLNAFAICCTVHAQYTFKATIKDKATNELLQGVLVQCLGSNSNSLSDKDGNVELINISKGKQIFVYNYLGYETLKDTLLFPLSSNNSIIISMTEVTENLEEVIVTTTRTSRNINDLPTRVEAVTFEELDEKATMKPGEIRMLLSESTGIQTQQTSATTGNQTIRIQGLDGRYTQLLKDGFPIYAGFASGLSIMQIPPLDLKQVEIIKGSASTLYGGGAIAGLINLISKTPSDKKELSFMINGTSAKGLDISGFYSQNFKKFGITSFGSYNGSIAYDPANNGFSAIPQYGRYTFNPRLFYYFNDKTKLVFGINTSFENRLGGDMQYIKTKKDSLYFEKNVSNRVSTQLSLDHDFGACSHITVKNSISIFNRDITKPNYLFSGNQLASFSEIMYANHNEKLDWVVGANAWTDHFSEQQALANNSRSYTSIVTGVFAQNTWKINKLFTLETGIRLDYAKLQNVFSISKNELFPLPRISALCKLSRSFSTRIGGGFGYKTASIFTETAESIAFKGINRIDYSKINAERSYGANIDFNFKTTIISEITLSVNQLFFYTILNKPIVFNADSIAQNKYNFENANGYLLSRGAETNIKIEYKAIKLFLGYTFVDVSTHYNNQILALPLTAKNRINAIIMYEKHNNFRIGFESFYVGTQTLSNGFVTNDYWIFGISLQKWWGKFIPFINLENFTDIRQTRFAPINTGSQINPNFMQIYAPLDGFVANAGLKITL